MGLCRRAQDWVWSSAHAHLLAEEDRLVQLKPMLKHIIDWDKYLPDVKCVGDLPQQISLHIRTG